MNERASVPSELGAVDDYKPSSVTTDHSSSTWTLLRQAVSVCAAAMASQGIPAAQRERVVNVVLFGHPDGDRAARITGRTREGLDRE